MKFAASLVLSCAVASAVSLESKTEAKTESSAQATASEPMYSGDAYFSHPGYVEPDYAQPYGEVLPGADFNRQVYEFDQTSNIWDQNDYEERVKVEAEMLVALEALKTSVGYIGYDLVTINGKIDHCIWRNNQDNSDIYEDEQANWDTYRSMEGKYGKCRDKC